jgi:hypothetical protein
LTFADLDVKAGVVHVRHQLSRAGKLVAPKTEAARREIEIPPSLGRLLAAGKEAAFARGQAGPAGFVSRT